MRLQRWYLAIMIGLSVALAQPAANYQPLEGRPLANVAAF